jgi:general secretion pathway protein B
MPQKAAPERIAPEGTALEKAAEKTAAAKPPAEKSAPSEAERVYAQRELPDDVRRALPPITVSGSTFSNDAASRMLMIGGQLYHEGDTVAPGVVLQRIKQRSAIFAFRGYRYEMSF